MGRSASSRCGAVPADQHVPPLEQVPVEDVEGFGSGVFAVVEVVERARRDRPEAQRQAVRAELQAGGRRTTGRDLIELFRPGRIAHAPRKADIGKSVDHGWIELEIEKTTDRPQCIGRLRSEILIPDHKGILRRFGGKCGQALEPRVEIGIESRRIPELRVPSREHR